MVFNIEELCIIHHALDLLCKKTDAEDTTIAGQLRERINRHLAEDVE